MDYWAIGDVHGEAELLKALIEVLPLNAGDGLIFLGDLIDRGPDTPAVLDQVLALSAEREVILIRGNHEHMMLGARSNRALLPDWLAMGGDATLDAYHARTFDAIPEAHWQLLKRGRLYFETEREIYVHANLDPKSPLSSQMEEDLLWKFYNRPVSHFSGKFMVCGHTPQASGHPKLDEHSICIDTLAPPTSSWLTAVNLGRRCFWQVDANGDERSDVLATLSDNWK